MGKMVVINDLQADDDQDVLRHGANILQKKVMAVCLPKCWLRRLPGA